MVGASGALYGVLVGFAMLFPNAQLMLIISTYTCKSQNIGSHFDTG
jgi:membrane associated rhomboid family serine protease